MSEVIVKPLVPLTKRWSVRAQIVFGALSAAAAAGWGVLQMYPATMERWGLGPGSGGGNLIADGVVFVLVINAAYAAFTVALAAMPQPQKE